MEKSNIINSIVSVFLMVVGGGFAFYVIMQNSYTGEHMMFLVIGIILIVYGLIRMVLTNRISRDI